MRLNRHETALVILYRIAPIALRRRIDTVLFDAWTQMPCSINPDHPLNARYRLAVAALHAERLVGKALAQFATFWQLSETSEDHTLRLHAGDKEGGGL